MSNLTFTSQVKDEIATSKLNELENRNLFLGYLYANGTLEKDKIVIFLENKNIAEKLFKTLKYCYHTDVKITIRTQKKFRVKRFFIFELTENIGLFEAELHDLYFGDKESIDAFIKGIFLATGSINDPKRNRYHLELTFDRKNKAERVLKILNDLEYKFKMIKREKNYMLYLKSSEEISDFLKLLGTVSSLFYYEDIRIYRDHANMVNRLNNCEQANFEKTLKTGDKQLSVIRHIKEKDCMSLLDEKTRQVAEYRLKYPEESFQSLANIISTETNKSVSKSYVNHHFRKINEIYEKMIDAQKK